MDNMKTQENKIQNEKNSLEHEGGSYDERELFDMVLSH